MSTSQRTPSATGRTQPPVQLPKRAARAPVGGRLQPIADGAPSATAGPAARSSAAPAPGKSNVGVKSFGRPVPGSIGRGGQQAPSATAMQRSEQPTPPQSAPSSSQLAQTAPPRRSDSALRPAEPAPPQPLKVAFTDQTSAKDVASPLAGPRQQPQSKSAAASSPAVAASPAKPPATRGATTVSTTSGSPSAIAASIRRTPTADAPAAEAKLEALTNWPELTAGQIASLDGTTMEPRFSGEWVNLFPGNGVFACRRCRSAIAAGKSKIRDGSGYAAFDRYCAANLRVELVMRAGDKAETAAAVRCRRCNGFIGELAEDGPTDSGECLRVSSLSVRWCNAIYAGVDGVFDRDRLGEEHADADEDDAEMYLEAEDVLRLKGAAWGKQKHHIVPPPAATASSMPPAKRSTGRRGSGSDASSSSESDDESDGGSSYS